MPTNNYLPTVLCKTLANLRPIFMTIEAQSPINTGLSRLRQTPSIYIYRHIILHEIKKFKKYIYNKLNKLEKKRYYTHMCILKQENRKHKHGGH